MTVIRKKKGRNARRERRHRRIRKKLWGTADRPRLVIFRSLKNIEGQLVDDDEGVTLLGVSTLGAALRDFEAEGPNRKTEQAFAAGKVLGEKAVEQGIESVKFDRGGFRYHGRVKAFAEGAREGGLQF